LLKRKLVMYPLLFTLAAAPLAGGCTVQRKPVPTPPPGGIAPAPAPTPGPAATPAPAPSPPGTIVTPGPVTPAPADGNREAQRMATLVARIRDVRSATVVLSGNTANVGLDIAGNVTGARTNAIKREAANVIRREDPRITTVYVATDADTVSRIRRVADGIARGTPVSGFVNELAEIQRRITPTRP